MGAVLTSAERARHKQRILEPGKWPYWPVLPLKRYRQDAGVEIAVICADYPEVVIHVGMFQIDRIALVLHQLSRDGEVEGVKTTRYHDVDGVLDDGWVVD